MAAEDYTLLDLRTRIKEDFGITDSDNDGVINRKINDALAWLVRRRQNWPWLSKNYVIDVPAGVSGTGDFTKGSRSLANVSGPTLVVRDVVTTQTDSGDATQGFTVVALGPPDTLNKQYLDTTEAGKALRQVKKWFQLPADFGAMEMVTLEGDLENPTVDYKPLHEFERTERRDTIHSLVPKIYTVTQDPLGTDAQKYLAIYPYLGSITTLHLKYWRIPDVLAADDDVPILPFEDKMVLFYGACWFFAQTQKESESVIFYRDLALQELEAMKQRYGFADDAYEDEDLAADPTNWVPGPSNFPEFVD